MHKPIDIYHAWNISIKCFSRDISKAFDKVWHKGLIYRLKQNGVEGDLLNTLTNFLKERKQKVILNVQYSAWTNVEAVVPQRSILGPLLFLIYINGLPGNLASNPRLGNCRFGHIYRRNL